MTWRLMIRLIRNSLGIDEELILMNFLMVVSADTLAEGRSGGRHGQTTNDRALKLDFDCTPRSDDTDAYCSSAAHRNTAVYPDSIQDDSCGHLHEPGRCGSALASARLAISRPPL